MTAETTSKAATSVEPTEPETPVKGIDREALKRLDAEIEARQRADAERIAAREEKTKREPKQEPEPAADTLPEITDPTLRRTMARLGERIKTNPRPVAREPEPTAEIVRLDFWEDDRRAAPNIVFRSALFPALNPKQERRYLDQERVFSTKGGEVYFTGKQFDQSDLDVYLEILTFARPFPLGTPVRFSAYSMLKALGRPTGGDHHKWLHGVIVRLGSCIVEMTDHKTRYGGALIHDFTKDETTGQYAITINLKFAVLFGYGLWSTLDKEQRHALKRNQTAKALHAYYSTHTAPGPHEYGTLAEIAGLTDKNPRKVKMKIVAAHEAMKQIGFLRDYEAGAKTIKTTINHTQNQNRHIVRQITQRRKPKKDPPKDSK